MKKWLSLHLGTEKPDYWKSYEHEAKQRLSKDMLIKDVPFVVLDTETTGLNPKHDRILSIGAIIVQGGMVHSNAPFHAFLKQDTYDRDSATVHGIRHEVVNQMGIPEEEAIQQLLELLGNKIIVGHHIGFDLLMLNAAAKRYGGGKIINSSLDTSNLFQRAFPQNYAYYYNVRPKIALDLVANTFNITAHDRHSALGDVMITALAFLKIVKKLEKRGVRTLKDLHSRFKY